jgi:hypothetical protein
MFKKLLLLRDGDRREPVDRPHKFPQTSCGILEARGIAASPHLAAMSPDAKRALLNALDAAGGRTGSMRHFEAAKTEANRVIRGESSFNLFEW